jgi:molybdopterin-guanine dinucleotide biosynthesis protein A
LTITGFVLAGGQSRRMGSDKALIHCGDEVLIQRTCRVALGCADRVYVVTPWGERYRPFLPPTVEIWPESPDLDSEGRRPGPLVALASVVSALVDDTDPPPAWVLALACDLPNLDEATLRDWASHLDSLPPSVMVYLPRIQGRWEPLCGFYRVACGASWQTYLETGGRSFQGWLNQQSVAAIPNVDPAWLINLNTPDDLTQFSRSRDAP